MNEDLPVAPDTQEETQKTTQQLAESLDYRDLLSSQIMAEQAKANASKYVMGGLQSSGVAQTGLAQSVLSGIQTGYQNTLAQNMNQFAMQQDIRQAGQLETTQKNAIDTATTLLQEPDLTQDEYKYIYDNYFNQMSPQDQQTFQFLYDRKGRELGYLDDGTTGVSQTVSNQLYENYGITNFQEASVNSLSDWDGQNNGTLTIGTSNIPFTFNKDGDFGKLLAISKNWKSDKNGYVIEIDSKLSAGKDFYVYYNGKWLKADKRSINEESVSKKFKVSFGKIVLA